MNELDLLKEKYYNLMIGAWNDNKTILIDSFVEYYGENYRDLITERINEIEFVYYAPISNLEFLDNLINELSSNDYSNYIEYRNIYQKCSNGNSEYTNNLIGATSKEVFNDDDFNKFAVEVVENGYFPTFSPVRIGEKNIRTILLPIFVMGDKSIIHEVNHAINYNPLASVYNKDDFITDVCKFGMNLGISNDDIKIEDILKIDNNEKDLEELLTERTSLDIEKIFHKLGGKFFYFNTVELQSTYCRNLYLIEDFYNNFKDLLKESRMTNNKNFLVEKVGKNNYEQFVFLLNKYYLGGTTTKELRDKLKENKKHYPEIYNIVCLMTEYLNKNKDLTEEELLQYYNKLEEQGHNIIPLEDSKKTK